MKKLILILAMTLFLTACGDPKNPAADDISGVNENTDKDTVTVFAKVKGIYGNELEVELGKMPERKNIQTKPASDTDTDKNTSTDENTNAATDTDTGNDPDNSSGSGTDRSANTQDNNQNNDTAGVPSGSSDGTTVSGDTGDGTTRPGRGGFGNMPEGFDPENLPDNIKQSMQDMKDSGTLPENFDPENIPDDIKEKMANGQTGQSRGMLSSNIELTGEVKSFIIPVGTKINIGFNKNGTTADFTQIAVDNILSISYRADENGVETVTSVTILNR